MKNIAVFVSGNGTNLQAIIDNIAAGTLPARCALVVSDRKDAFALARAQKSGIKTLYLAPRSFENRRAYEQSLIDNLEKEKVDLVVLAGFMRILSPFFVKAYRGRILNIHPALLPAFPGMDAIRQAYRAGSKVTGVTVHFVDEEVDHGPVVIQRSVPISETESCEELEARIHEVEHQIYPEAIGKVLKGEITFES